MALRKRNGYSQEKLAEEAGINIRTLQRLEKDQATPQPYTLDCLAKALQVSIEDLCDFSEKLLEVSPQQLGLLHFSAVTGCIVPLGNIIAPYLLSVYQKNKTATWDVHYKTILNFQLSWLLYTFIVLAFFFTMASLAFVILIIPIMAFFSLAFCPLFSGIRVLKGKTDFYPLSLKII